MEEFTFLSNWLLWLIAAAIGSVLSFIAFKPLIKRQAEARRHRDCLSNMDALIGRTTTVTEAIGGNTPGRVRIDGDNWQAVSADASPINVGTKVRVTGYDSIILTVEREEE